MSETFTVTATTPSTPTLTVNATTVDAGDTVTATFSNIASPTAADWIALYAQGVADTGGWKDCMYAGSCSKTPGTARASGSCQFTIPSGLSTGTYQLRLFSNGSWTRLAVSETITVTATTPSTPTLTVNATTVDAGDTVTATFSNISSPTSADWIALYAQGVADTSGGWKDWYVRRQLLQDPRYGQSFRFVSVYHSQRSVDWDLPTASVLQW